MYFVVDGSVYAEREDGKFVNIEVTAKDKVTITRELESVTVTEGDVVIDSVEGAIPCTLATIIAKFNVSEQNPVPFAQKPKKKASKAKAVKEPAEDDF